MPPPLGDVLQPLFQAVEWPNPTARVQTVQKGSVILFNYLGQRPKHNINDPYPLLIVSDPAGINTYDSKNRRMVFHPDIVRGVNLHYLTLPFVQALVRNYTTPSFSYQQIKGTFAETAFRSYKRAGISNQRMLDITFLKNLLSVVRALNVNEIEEIRRQIQEMIANPELVQPVAEPGEQILT